MLVHIAGSPGSGKTYIGEQFNAIDTDIWREEFDALKGGKTAVRYKRFIEDKIKQLSGKSVILVGVLDDFIGGVDVFPEIPADIKLFIKIDPKVLFKRFNNRLINHICKHQKEALKRISQYKIYQFKSLDEITADYKKDYQLYVEQHGYMCLTQTQIINKLRKLIDD